MKEKRKKKKSFGKRLRNFICIILVLAVVILIGGANVMYSVVLEADSKIGIQEIMMKQFQKENDTDATPAEYSGFTGDEATKSWFDCLKEDAYITSEDGLKLHAYEIRNVDEKSNGNYVIICHGYTSQATDMVYSMKHYFDLGYSILAPDARAHGESEGNVRGMGWLERRDIVHWAEYINENNDDTKIVLYGISMGGATVMMTSGEADLPINVVAVVEDCGYSSVWDIFEIQINKMFHLPAFPMLNVCSLVTKIRGDYSFEEASSVDQLKYSDIPTLFIHGTADDFVDFSMLDIVYEAANCEKEKLEIEGAGHAMSSATDPELYWSTVDAFLEKHV